jgi:thioredoxin-like negative regulator of GroEL
MAIKQQFTYLNPEAFLKHTEEESQKAPFLSDKAKELAGYSALNLQRMNRILKTMTILAELEQVVLSLNKAYEWIIITEPWCGDSAQILPVWTKVAELNPNRISVKIVLRDQNEALMNQYLTNGSKSIPKVVCFDGQANEVFVWGARPVDAQEIMTSWKNNPQGKSWEQIETELHTWYAKDKTYSTQKEILQLLRTEL